MIHGAVTVPEEDGARAEIFEDVLDLGDDGLGGAPNNRHLVGLLLEVAEVVGPILVILTLNVAGAILTEAALGYLGLGVSAPTATWGSMLVQGQRLIRVAPHVAIFPGIAIFLTALSFNLLGEGLRDILDPATQRRV